MVKDAAPFIRDQLIVPPEWRGPSPTAAHIVLTGDEGSDVRCEDEDGADALARGPDGTGTGEMEAMYLEMTMSIKITDTILKLNKAFCEQDQYGHVRVRKMLEMPRNLSCF